MRRALLLALAGLALAPGSPDAATQRSLGVSLREFRVGPYRDTVRLGSLKVNAFNFGEDPHDLVLRTRRGTVLGRTPEVRAGEVASFRVRLRRTGRYVLACTLPGHEAAGMRARLRVIRGG